jgi:hypothetical protein
MTGTKYDENKPPMALLDPEYLLGVANVLGFGATKYSPNNWRGGLQYTRLISAALRHISAINMGEDCDSETGLSHAYHLGCCAMFLASMMNHRPDMDDRYKGKPDAIKLNVDNPRTMVVRDVWNAPFTPPWDITCKVQGN